MANVYGVDGTCSGGNFATPNLNRIPSVTEDEFVDADVNHEIGHLSQEYRQWRRQTDGAATKFTRSSADADYGLDTFSGQSRSTNMVPFHMLHIVSYCAIVTLSLRCAVFYDIRLQKIS